MSVLSKTELEREQEYVRELYERVSNISLETESQLAAVRRNDVGGGHQARSERDSFAKLFEDRLAQLREVGDRLAFGRLTGIDEAGNLVHNYIGRIGLRDEELRPILLDWRVPQASAFYQATALNPMGAKARRHLYIRDRELIRIEDELFDSEMLASDGIQLQGEGALLASLSAERTGRMTDIVATIQAEQDRVIRSDLRGILVVQGGPGTGKTAVALHRAAFLMYAHRERLRSTGVLIVGPSASFVRYIEAVLPSLGESGVVLSSLGQLFPGVVANFEDSPERAKLKGDLRMAGLIERAVRSRQIPPTEVQDLEVNGDHIEVDPETIARCVRQAQSTGKPHNEARLVFARAAITSITESFARKLQSRGAVFDESDLAILREDVRTADSVRVYLNSAWLPLTPQKLIQDLFARPNWLFELTPDWSQTDRDLLLRERSEPFTISDIPLLDEAAELLGEAIPVDHSKLREHKEQQERDLENAKQAIKSFGVSGFVDAKTLAAGFAEYSDPGSTAERAANDRTWAFGHIVVDEAQELSPMQWRLLRRRGPSLSFTIVGDIAQSASSSAALNWSKALAPLIGKRNESEWLVREELTVNYRTPALIANQAELMAKSFGLPVTESASVRDGDWPIEFFPELKDAFIDIHKVPGTIGVVAPRQKLDAVFEQLQVLCGSDVGIGAEGIDSRVSVMTTHDAKGLEFDTVVVIDPQEIIGESTRGPSGLYVAMTRSTSRLIVVGDSRLPSGPFG
ncbi:MAG: AAA family ATPase [Microbacteriaceae bacterium]|nr:AAA family ATPase [Microbacteriaceae bacterium]